ncbi:phosphatidylserine/phosphatidylglycerophosphate/cardiolipin synthase family protein [Bdellovibrio bacteriovorus]|uniref:phospholipase D-like domain-containing protein n=1 Tax=Bdellovibrio bacteriovorus TaxID=959 RepID=UPI0021D05679|nr:phosphatidylserine/phosphatidylglycerophosphate/cardiolipin synthase family protein [Bdellovibrio bacteriovorus]UXR65497.1 phosphatidylserine/phosphatidylglycerophosphate/cardiolipin synthase family protein [Bdellovibrio bacteriovorus]
MKLLWVGGLVATVSLFAACTGPQRAPSSIMYDDERANRIQEIDVELSHYWNKDWEYNQELFQKGQQNAKFDRKLSPTSESWPHVESLLTERSQEINQLSSKLFLREWSGIGPWFEASFRPRLFDKEEIITIKSMDDFKLGNPQGSFPIEHNFYQSYTLRFENDLPVSAHFRHDRRENEKKYLKARLECDGDIIHPGKWIFSGETRSQVYEFNWYYNQENGQRVRVKFAPRVNYCKFYFRDPENSKTWTNGLQLVDIGRVSHEWIKLTNQIDICARPQGSFGKDPAAFFWTQDFNYTTCPQTFDKLVNLRDPYTSMNQKILSLTGSPLKRKDFNNKNPMAELDFSKAPKFDIIWVSSLNFSADFYGMVLSSALRYHAQQGTQIRILVPEVTMTRKDKAIIERLQQGLPNIKVQYYKYTLSDQNNGGWLDKFHRVNHTKLIIGHSSSDPKASFLITGGRNIRDSYIFSDTPFYKAYKFLKNYGDGEEDYIYYDDFEIEIRGYSFVKSVMAQMLAFWMRDPESQRYRSTNVNVPKEASMAQVTRLRTLPDSTPLVRHITSMPYFDGYQLEKFYIDMFDSAQSELLLTTPYFRPSVAISAALDRAVQRGVKVKIITRIHLAGDGTPRIAEDVNKQGINRHLKDVEIYEWTQNNSIMHAKILVIDKKLSFISSVNMNRRSFIHDTESGVLILHAKTAMEMRKEALDYISKGRRITASEKVGWINSTLIDWADSYF